MFSFRRLCGTYMLLPFSKKSFGGSSQKIPSYGDIPCFSHRVLVWLGVLVVLLLILGSQKGAGFLIKFSRFREKGGFVKYFFLHATYKQKSSFFFLSLCVLSKEKGTVCRLGRWRWESACWVSRLLKVKTPRWVRPWRGKGQPAFFPRFQKAKE